MSLPIVKYDFKDIIELGEKTNSGEFFIRTSMIVEMKENNFITPYKFVQVLILIFFSKEKNDKINFLY
jgi:hypothetical protein